MRRGKVRKDFYPKINVGNMIFLFGVCDKINITLYDDA